MFPGYRSDPGPARLPWIACWSAGGPPDARPFRKIHGVAAALLAGNGRPRGLQPSEDFGSGRPGCSGSGAGIGSGGATVPSVGACSLRPPAADSSPTRPGENTGHFGTGWNLGNVASSRPAMAGAPTTAGRTSRRLSRQNGHPHLVRTGPRALGLRHVGYPQAGVDFALQTGQSAGRPTAVQAGPWPCGPDTARHPEGQGRAGPLVTVQQPPASKPRSQDPAREQAAFRAVPRDMSGLPSRAGYPQDGTWGPPHERNGGFR